MGDEGDSLYAGKKGEGYDAATAQGDQTTAKWIQSDQTDFYCICSTQPREITQMILENT